MLKKLEFTQRAPSKDKDLQKKKSFFSQHPQILKDIKHFRKIKSTLLQDIFSRLE